MRDIPGIDYRFDNPELLELALTHRSVGKNNNERLEFLGDSILSAVVSARLFDLKKDNDEGELSRLRARLVRGETLAKLALGLNLGDFIRLGEGEMKSGGFNRESILADALEAVLGAIYLDGGYEACAVVILQVLGQELDTLPDANELKDPKTRFQEWLQGHAYPLPEYSLLSEDGPPHRKRFVVQAAVDTAGIKVDGKGSSRQKAEQAAAVAALEYISASQLKRQK
jgi:ribonuclease-3